MGHSKDDSEGRLPQIEGGATRSTSPDVDSKAPLNGYRHE
jgi:hypothetical protein